MANKLILGIIREMREMVGITLYLFFIFSAFITYRSLILAELGIEYHELGFAVIKALVFAKVILIIKFISFVRRFDDKPLIIPTAYKIFVFTVFSLIFAISEHTIRGLINGLGFAGAIDEVHAMGTNEMLSRLLVYVFALIPYFIMNEVTRVVGKGKVIGWFFKPRPQ